ncbi:hypothetical protein [Kribbella sp. NPDC023855]|uniref:hypothetical protein n=1 Tax=Kribbella sp. NPDC023855 TaxID=3154698 RepID=UPI0033F32036
MDRVRIGSGLLKALIAACLLAGVFTMHGLTGNHDAAMALVHQLPTQVGVQHSDGSTQVGVPHSDESTLVGASHSHGSTQVGLPHSDESAPHTGVPVLAVGQAVVEIGPFEDHGHIHSMEDVCLAMLVALLLALVVAVALRSSVTAHPAVLAAAPVRVVADGPSPPWRRPTLSKLCVLRT